MMWYNIPGTDRYKICKDGFIMNVKTNNITAGSITSQGYRELRIQDSKRVTIYRKLIHVILAEMFLTKPEDDRDYVVDHKDNNKQNNELSNLQYVTRQVNSAKAQEVRDASKTYKAVYQLDLDDNILAEHRSIKEACEALGVNNRSPLIAYACKGKCSTNNCFTAYGYKWRYVEDDIVQSP